MKTIQKGEAFASGWDGFEKNWKVFVSMGFLYGFLIGLELLTPRLIPSVALQSVCLLGLKGVEWLFGFGLCRVSLAIVDEKPVSIRDFFSISGFLEFGAASLLCVAIVFLGTVLLVVPGIVLWVTLSQYIYVLADKGCGPIQALKESRSLTRGARLPILGFLLLWTGLNLLGLLFFGVGLFVSVPVGSLAMAHVYRQLTRQQGLAEAFSPASA